MSRSFTTIAHAPCILRVVPQPKPGQEGALARVASVAMLGIIGTYRKYLTENMLPNCRFQPTCSAYMMEAIQTYGAWRGFILSSWRIIRCNPSGGAGYDPVRWPPVSYRSGSWTD